jgi:lipoate-protein ligase A
MSYAVADGPHNMAADEVLLESGGAGVASLRFYGWSEATLSLGYFQPEWLRHSDQRLAGLPFVRRMSGGAALVHHHEVTYALALPAGPPWQTGEPWLTRAHHLIATALQALGVSARLHPPDLERPFPSVLCFQHFTPGDVVIGSAKVVGSAQRRQRKALLQHGGILLTQSPYTPVLPGISELTHKKVGAEQLVGAIIDEFARSTSWKLTAGEWTPEERRRTEHLTAVKYRQNAWNRKR